MQRKKQIRVDSLSRLLVYILGHRPDEFGLVPDEEDFVAFKDLLPAIHEEPGWGYVRQGHIQEVLIGKDRPLFEYQADRMRAKDRRWSFNSEKRPASTMPKILFTPVRRRAHPHALEKGLRSDRFLVLTPDRDMAERIGRRKDQKPVLMEILTESAQEQGIPFFPFGQLVLTPEIPARFISGPPLSKEALAAKEPEKAKKARPEERPIQPFAGTFVLDMARDPDPRRRSKARKDRGWKEEARRLRRRKNS
ncbi:MAG: hypothetical protein KKE57_07105 [Proteobacteria bacterium]|nr:hypothetical protein [Pseudomonadota bacterium]